MTNNGISLPICSKRQKLEYLHMACLLIATGIYLLSTRSWSLVPDTHRTLGRYSMELRYYTSPTTECGLPSIRNSGRLGKRHLDGRGLRA